MSTSLNDCTFRWADTDPDELECGAPATVKHKDEWLCDEHYDVRQYGWDFREVRPCRFCKKTDCKDEEHKK